MNNTELYINDRLVDTGGDLGVRLNRKLIDPGALNTVDAQFSFSISLPPTQVNVEVFDYAFVEETRDKFNRVYKAELIVNGSRIFGPGLFRLTSINNAGAKGQLYMPAKKTIKDIFGELKLNENAPLYLPFLDFVEYVNLYNTAAANAPQAAIFPYILYGVLPKLPLNRNANLYSARDLWDSSVRIGIADLAPAINPMIMLKHIFTSRGYTLQGNAFQDDKLAKLYETYKNAPDYVQPWNYGYHAKMKVSGAWSSRYNARTGGEQLERGVGQSSDQTGPLFTCDLFDATNTSLNVIQDNGGNVLYKEINGGDGRTWVSAQIRIPTAGFYKVKFDAGIHVYDSLDWRATDPATGVQHVGGRTDNAVNDFNDNMYGMRLVRDRGTGDFGIYGAVQDGVFYYNNQPQNNIFDGNNVPKYFPQAGADGQINFVDAAQDQNILAGFEFGRHAPSGDTPANPDFYNPRAGLGPNAQIIVAKPATSWDTSVGNDNLTKLAIKAPGYWKYGRIGNFDNPGDNPNINLDYSDADRVLDKALDANGNPGADVAGNVILSRFQLARFYTYQISAPALSNYEGVAYVHNGDEVTPTFTVPFVDGAAEFDTSLSPVTNFNPRLTLYLKSADFDVDGTLIISRRIEGDSEDVIDWELTDKYKIDLNNAPANFAKRGQFDGAPADNNWFAQGSANVVVWLEAGELISIASVSSEGRYRKGGMHSTFGWASHEIHYDLSIEPFRAETEWLKVDLRGNGTAVMNWNDPISFDVDRIDLVKFLSADTKTDDYIENFCKAYNLGLTQVDAATFSLDVKQSKTAVSNLYIDLDQIASVKQRENTALGLPSRYVLGFAIDIEEEGFVKSCDQTITDLKARIASGETGGGTFDTGATEENVVTQTSTFSYTWYKAITKEEPDGNIIINLPIVSKAEVWDPAVSYPDAMKKRYTDLAQRFMYFAGILPGTFEFNGQALQIANVSNELPGSSILNYKNKLHTILYNYFTLLINGASHYTNIKAYLTPAQYIQLNGSLSVKFNGDMYFAAELTGYDPYNKNQTTIKLIRKI